jgi:hypothetical protein
MELLVTNTGGKRRANSTLIIQMMQRIGAIGIGPPQ